MVGWAVPQATSGEEKKQKQPWVLKMDQVVGVGGVSILGGIFIAAAFAAGKLLARRSPAECKGSGEEENRHACREENHKMEIMHKEIYDFVKEIKDVERTPWDKSEQLLEDSELDNAEQEKEDVQRMEILDKSKFPYINIDGEDNIGLNLSSSNVAQEGPESFTNGSEVEEEEEEEEEEREEEEEEEDCSSEGEGEEEAEAEDGNEEVIKMGELEAEVTPVSSSSSSLESSSEVIWPDEVLEQEKTLPSALIMNSPKIEQVEDEMYEGEEESEGEGEGESEEEEDSGWEETREERYFCKEDLTSEEMKAQVISRKMTSSMDNEVVIAFTRLLLLLLMAVMSLCLGLLLASSMENVSDHLRHFQKHSRHFFQTIFAAALN